MRREVCCQSVRGDGSLMSRVGSWYFEEWEFVIDDKAGAGWLRVMRLDKKEASRLSTRD